MRQVLFTLLFLMPIFSSASIWDEEILLYDDGTVKVEIQFRLRDSTCELSTSNKYRFIVKGLRTYTAYYEAMFEFEDCQGRIVERRESIQIGGPGAFENKIESIDYQFKGTLSSVDAFDPVPRLLQRFDQFVVGNNIDGAEAVFEEIKKYSTDDNLIARKYASIGTLYMKKEEKELDDFLDMGYFRSAYKVIERVRQLSYDYGSSSTDYIRELEDKLAAAAQNKANKNIVNGEYSDAIVVYKMMLELTKEKHYNTKIEAVEQRITDERNQDIEKIFYGKEYLAKYSLNNKSFELWFDVYQYQNSNASILGGMQKDWGFLSDLLTSEIKAGYLEAKSLKKEKDYFGAQKSIDKSFQLQFKHQNRDFYVDIDEMEEKVKNLKDEIDREIDLYSESEIEKRRLKYQLKKLERETIRIGASCNLLTILAEDQGNSLNWNEIVDTRSEHFDNTDLSYFNFNMFFGRTGFYLGDMIITDISDLSTQPYQINTGAYVKLNRSLYLRAGYVYSSFDQGVFYSPITNQLTTDIPVIESAPYFTGLSLIGPIQIEFGYNWYAQTYSLGVGISFSAYHEDYKQSKKALRNYK